MNSFACFRSFSFLLFVLCFASAFGQKSLHTLVKECNVQGVAEYLNSCNALELKEEINKLDRHDNTPLVYTMRNFRAVACISCTKNKKILKLSKLVVQGVQELKATSSKFLDEHQDQRLAIAGLLLAHDAVIKNKYGLTLIHHLAFYGDAPLLELVVRTMNSVELQGILHDRRSKIPKPHEVYKLSWVYPADVNFTICARDDQVYSKMVELLQMPLRSRL